MALTLEQQQALIRAKAQGLTKEQALGQVFRSADSKPKPSRFADAGEDVATAFKEAQTDVKTRGGNITKSVQAGMRGEQTPIETGLQIGGESVLGLTDLAFRGAQAAVKPFMSQEEEENLAETVGGAVEKTGIPKFYEGLSDRTKRNLAPFQALAELAPIKIPSIFKGKGKGAVSPSLEVQAIDDVIETASKSLKRQADDVKLTPRQREEAAQASLTFQEKYIGLTPDIKKRLGEMGPDKLQEYLDAVHLRNIDDTVPTPFEHGGNVVAKTEGILQTKLNDTGSGIGQTREKLATVQLSNPQVVRINNAFGDELSRLKLEIVDGKIVRTPGKITPVESGDVRALQSLLEDLKRFKQSPTVANAIDLRKNFDGKIKFGKSAREVSNNVDGVSRGVRKTIAKEAATTVGKQNAAELAKYSDFMDAYGDLQSFTNRAAGGEYLLRLVLSGRGGEARKLIQTIKEYTGVDLMNDATAMKIATEMLGNEQTKNLFRQEVTRAGYDAGAVLTGSPTGVLSVVGKRLLDYGINPEDVLKSVAAGTGGYLLMTYMGEEGSLLAPGIAILSAMPNKARMEALDQALEINAGKRALAKDGTATAKNLDKANKELVKLKQQYAKTSGKAKAATPETTDLLSQAKGSDLVEEARKYKSASAFRSAAENDLSTAQTTRRAFEQLEVMANATKDKRLNNLKGGTLEAVLRDNPSLGGNIPETVTVYRTGDGTINEGQFVSLEKSVAQQIADGRGGETAEMKVPTSDLQFANSDEFFYVPQDKIGFDWRAEI